MTVSDPSFPVVILQVEKSDINTRFYETYDSFGDCFHALIHCVNALRQENNQHQPVTVQDMTNFLDSLRDITCMVLYRPKNQYGFYSSDWVKSKAVAFMNEFPEVAHQQGQANSLYAFFMTRFSVKDDPDRGEERPMMVASTSAPQVVFKTEPAEVDPTPADDGDSDIEVLN